VSEDVAQIGRATGTLGQALVDELAGRGDRVVAVAPSRLDAVPPADVAAVAGFLCSDRAEGVSGAAIPVSGWA
jgi:NAD(P)-dependent dehydrogenase (short-subunit alcohol dehydrogenase family)